MKKSSCKNENGNSDYDEKELDKADNAYNERINIFYSQIINISSGAIVFSVTICTLAGMRILAQDKSQDFEYLFLLPLSWLLFLCAIISGIFLFLMLAKKYHRCAHFRYDKNLDENKRNEFGSKCNNIKVWDKHIHHFCIISFILGLVLLIIFSLKNLF